MSIAYEHIEALPAQDTERQREPIPRSKAQAREPFRCDTLGCRLSGVSCAQRHRGVQEGRVDSTETCGTCPAGAARLRILGAEVPTPQDSAAKRARLAGMTTRQKRAVHRADGWIKGSYERSEARGRRVAACLAADGQTRGAQAAPRGDLGAWAPEGVNVATTMRLVEPVELEVVQPGRPGRKPRLGIETPRGVVDPATVDWSRTDDEVARELGATVPSVVYWRRKAGVRKAQGRTAKPPRGTCARVGCDYPVLDAQAQSALPDFCVTCREAALKSLKRKLKRLPTTDERRAWLVANPRGGERKAAVTQPLPVVTVEVAPDAPIAVDPQPVEVPASVDALARLTMQRDDADAASDRLRDQLDAAWKECGELRRDLDAALKTGREWRRVAESAMGRMAQRREDFARAFMLGAGEYVDVGR